LDSAPDAGPYVAVEFIGSSTLDSKVRQCTISVDLLSGSATMIGVLSSGSSTLIPQVNNALRSTTIHVVSTGTLPARCLYVNGDNRVALQNLIMFCEGSGSDLVACEVNHTNSVLSIKQSSVSGKTSDLLQTNGKILLGASDLINHTAPLGFDVDISPNSMFYGILGFPGGNLTYYLPPGITPIASVSTASPYLFTFIDPVVAFGLSITYLGTINNPDTVTFAIYKNGVATGLTYTLTSVSGPTGIVKGVGVTFLPGDTIDARLTTVGNPNAGAFTGSILIY